MNNRSDQLSVSDESETLGIMHEPFDSLDLRLRQKCLFVIYFTFFYQPVPLTLSVSSK